MAGRNRIVGGRRFATLGHARRGKAAFVNLAPADGADGVDGDDGSNGSDGAPGADGADGTQVIVAVAAGFDPDDYPAGTVAFFVDDLAEPTAVQFGGKKGDGDGGGFPEPLPLESA